MMVCKAGLVQSLRSVFCSARVQLSECEIRELQRERAKMDVRLLVSTSADQAELDVEIE